jgi:hypothetical protein
MLRRFALLGLLLAGGLVLATLPSAAQDKKDDTPDKETVEKAEGKAALIEDLTTAARLTEFGRKYKVPEALVAAGDLLRKVELNSGDKIGDLTEKPTDENDKEIKDETKKAPSLSEQYKALFAEAEGLAAESPKLSAGVTALVKEAEKRTYHRDVFGGPKRVERAINPGQTHIYHIPFITNVPASVGLTSQGSSLHFQVKAGDNELFGVRGNYANYNWTPRGGATKTFTIVVRNVGKSGSVYTLLAN